MDADILYRPLRIRIGIDNINGNIYDALRHEMGHLTDYFWRKFDQKNLRLTQNDDFVNAVETDHDLLKGDPERCKRIAKHIRQVPGAKFNGDIFIWDTFGSLTWNWGNRRVGRGHRQSYYARIPERRDREIFANLFAIYSRTDKTAWNYVKTELPNISKIFKEIIERLAGLV